MGGLAVLVHIGAIGMSVPYLISLNPSGEDTATTIPIEFVVESAPIQPAPVQPTAAESSESVESRRSTDTTPIASPADSISAGSPASPVYNNRERNTEKVAGQNGVLPIDPQETVAQETDSPDTEPKVDPSDLSSGSDVGSAADDSAATEPTSQPSSASSQAAAEPTDESLPVISGEPIQAPAPGSEAGQTLQVRIVGEPQYAPLNEFEETPPELISKDYASLMRPEAEGCEQVSPLASQAPLVYRIGVALDGTVASISLHSGQPIEPGSADDSAVVCLIQQTGIAFRRFDTSDGESLVGRREIDDSLLVTFELSEQ